MPEKQNKTIPEAELARQRAFAQAAAPLLAARFGARPAAYVHTYGCQQNVSDSERMKGMLAEMGFCFVEEADAADLVLYNTCAVREHAEDRVFGNVGALKHKKRRSPECILALCGCMMQQQRVSQRIRASFPYVDLVFGTHALHRLPELVYRLLTGERRIFELGGEDLIAERLPVKRDSDFKGWLPVMYGCNNFCSYCIVPYVRGRERSRRPEEILAEAREMVDAGFKDITLLGQNVNSYGRDCGFGVDFAGLLRRLNALEGDFRLRFMTSHPKDCTPALLDAMRDCEKVCGHLHLPVQAGSDRVLRAMNRGYTARQYLELVRAARERMPELSLTSDVIVGFPGETYEEFRQTLALLRAVEFQSLFTFIYSPRPGTPAAALPDPVPYREKTEWLAELLQAQEEIAARQNARRIGTELRVLCEDVPEPGRLFGRAENNLTVEFDGPPALLGQFAQVEVTEARNWILRGRLAPDKSEASAV